MVIEPRKLRENIQYMLNTLKKNEDETWALLKSPEFSKTLEEKIDADILNKRKIKPGFWGRKKIIANLKIYPFQNPCIAIPFSMHNRELKKLINGILSPILKKYKLIGWKVRRTICDNDHCIYLYFSLPITASMLNAATAKKSGLKEKQAHLIKLKEQSMSLQLEMHKLEAEIQMLTESPNSRDPLLLPETAGK